MLEVCVVVGILGLLAALTLPAVMGARETARRMECASNLRQILIAYHNYEQTYHEFPGFQSHSYYWDVGILPYMEVPFPVKDASGKLLSAPESVPLYRCPTDPYAEGTLQEKSYWPNMGTTHEERDGLYIAAGNRPVRSADVTDGLSTTSALSERLVHLDIENPLADESLWKHRVVRTTTQFIPDLGMFAEECELRSANPRSTLYHSAGFNHVQTPNRNSCTNGPRVDPRSKHWMAITAASLHRGGVNVAMADGSVRFVSDAVDHAVWWAMGSRATEDGRPSL